MTDKHANERTETHACDLISRQVAISVIAKWMLEYGGEGEERERNALKQAAEEIKNLPSAQPEILTCEDCEYADDKPISDGRHWCTIHGSFMYYCSDAERRKNG